MSSPFTIIFTSLATATFLHLYSESRDRLNERNRAASNFRDVLLKDIRNIDPNTNHKIDVLDALTATWPNHNAALQELKLFLTETEINSIDVLWREYCYNEKGQYPDLDQYSNRSGSVTTREEKKALAYKRLNSLFYFAEPKKHWLSQLFADIKRRVCELACS